MTATVIDGRKIAEALRAEVTVDVEELESCGIRCGLVTVAVGDDYAAGAYMRRISRIASEVGVYHRHIGMPGSTNHDELTNVVKQLNQDRDVTGILILRPLPPHLREAQIFGRLSPIKDIEAVHPENAGLLALGTPRYVSATSASIFHVLDSWLDEAGENRADFYHRSLIVIVGRSNNVGKPAVSMAYDRQAAVESIDEWASTGGRLGWHTRRAQVVVVAAGVPGLIKAEHIREGAVVLDVGINPIEDPRTGKVHLVGDVSFEEVARRARAITPVPGGIGPVTDMWVIKNLVTAARLSAQD